MRSGDRKDKPRKTPLAKLIGTVEPMSREYYEVLRRMSGEERLRIALELSEMLRAIAMEGIKAQNPDLTPEELKREMVRRMMLWHRLNSLERSSKR
ncbi:hypothetical protein DRP77_05935 [Candidatus Poribacteria bacterium]|nr:MAG: hypothetical protein DRP77_05935 [Candidatus Poribacteria bacterium]